MIKLINRRGQIRPRQCGDCILPYPGSGNTVTEVRICKILPLQDQNEKARKDIVLFGIPEREARIYLALLLRGQSKAVEVAAYLGLHWLDVYHDLKSMQSKNMVEATISKL